MPIKVLVAYTTNAGSTREVAEAIAGELRKEGATVEARRLEEIEDLSAYQAVVVGGPMIVGWHRGAVSFLKKHQPALSRIPVAYFFTAMSLTRTGDASLNGVPVHIDPNLPKESKNATRLSLRERYATMERYLGPVLRAAPQVRPVSVGFFGGKLDYSRLKLLQMLFVMLIIQIQPGDRRNWPAIQEWATSLSTAFNSAV
jgi:menaquinone-dependent protoporphyrinogen IX oxidase